MCRASGLWRHDTFLLELERHALSDLEFKQLTVVICCGSPTHGKNGTVIYVCTINLQLRICRPLRTPWYGVLRQYETRLASVQKNTRFLSLQRHLSKVDTLLIMSSFQTFQQCNPVALTRHAHRIVVQTENAILPQTFLCRNLIDLSVIVTPNSFVQLIQAQLSSAHGYHCKLANEMEGSIHGVLWNKEMGNGSARHVASLCFVPQLHFVLFSHEFKQVRRPDHSSPRVVLWFSIRTVSKKLQAVVAVCPGNWCSLSGPTPVYLLHLLGLETGMPCARMLLSELPSYLPGMWDGPPLKNHSQAQAAMQRNATQREPAHSACA